MLKTGTFLQNRYEIIACIGSGGMADVYKAKDHKLNRFVAVKTLKPEFRNDNAFLSKFRVEAQAAAGLSHVNIVNVYDVGEEYGINFIVMELVEGITLKSYIAKKGMLTVREATSIALQVAAGLEAAHNNGIIHRDVKPQNIIISVDGKAKVTDFGIARAVSSNTINSSVMGSVHYCSPEQTRGGYSDAKSDIYSMGITMYEMVTGRVPFDGDNTVTVALKHLQEEIPSPRRFAPEIPFSTEQIILKCTQKSPDRRYNNLGELIRDLKESLVNPEGNFVSLPNLNNNANTKMLSRDEVNRIKSGSLPGYDENMNIGAAETFVDSGNVAGDKRSSRAYGSNYYQTSGYQDLKYTQDGYVKSYPDQVYHAGAYQGGYGNRYQERMDYPAGDDPDDGEDDDFGFDDLDQQGSRSGRKHRKPMSSRTEKLITIFSIVVAVVVGCILLALIGKAIGLFHFGDSGKSSAGDSVQTVTMSESNLVKVPYIVGKTEAEAQSLLRSSGLGYEYQGESSSSQYAKGLVVSQSIDAGADVEKNNATVGYVLSSGPNQPLTVPMLANVQVSEAEKTLTGMKLKVKTDNSRYSDTVPEGCVITTNPGSGSSVQIGDTITLYVSQGQGTSEVTVPEVTGHYEDDAAMALRNLGLYVYITYAESDMESGLVIEQDVAPGTSVHTGTSITITVSEGRPEQAVVFNPESQWQCNVQLSEPEGFGGQPVRIELVQGDKTTVVFEGTTTFPYYMNATGQPGISSGTVYVYLLDPQTWEVTSTISYEGIIFSQVN